MKHGMKNRYEFFELSKIRRRLVLVVILSIFVALFSRAFYVQVIKKDYYQFEGFKSSNKKIDLPAYRGKIYDRQGKVLAASAPVNSITVYLPVLNEERAKKGKNKKILKVKLLKLAKLLKMNFSDLDKKLKRKKRGEIVLKRQLDPKTGSKVMALNIKGVTSKKTYKRYYPNDIFSAHAVGLATADGVGKEGIEKFMNTKLAGKGGSKKVIWDSKERTVGGLGEVVVPVDGKDIHLTIDSRLQEKMYGSLKKAVDKHEAKSGSAILIDSRTGEVIAMSNFPSYDPNNLTKNQTKFVKNKALIDVYEPGSTLKPISISLALEKNLINEKMKFDTKDGKRRIGGRTITDHHPHGVMTVAQIVQKSSNVGTTMIFDNIKPSDLWDIYHNFGFGSKTGIEFPGERKGVHKSYESWKEIDFYTRTYGYGINGSLAQIVRAYTPFANEGELMPLTMIKSAEPVIGKKVLSKMTSNTMLKILEGVISIDGTAHQAIIPGYRVAGKTGTARGYDGGYDGTHMASFVGIAPASDPKFIMAVMIHAPTKGGIYGGVMAAPVFKEVVTEALKLYSIPQDGLTSLHNGIIENKAL